MSLKNIIKSCFSYDQKLLLRLFYNMIRNPKGTKYYFNYYKYNRSVGRRSAIDFVPPVFGAVITDDCNLRCPNCLYLLENPDKFFASFISPDKFRDVLDKYNRRRKAEIIFLDGGEPLLHPEFDLIVDICKEHNLSTKISTNGTLIKNKITSLRKLDYVNVSVDAHDYESYKKYRGGSPYQFDAMLEGLRLLKKNKVNFSMSFLLSVENLFEVDRMIVLAEDIKPNFIYFHNVNPHGCVRYTPLTLHDRDTIIFMEKMLKRTDYLFNINISAIFDVDSPSFLQKKCIQPWYYFLFNSIGDVSYCCHLSHDVKIGNVFNRYDFNSEKMVVFRKDIIEGKVSKSCLYCQRRFMGKEFASFNAKEKKWLINN